MWGVSVLAPTNTQLSCIGSPCRTLETVLFCGLKCKRDLREEIGTAQNSMPTDRL